MGRPVRVARLQGLLDERDRIGELSMQAAELGAMLGKPERARENPLNRVDRVHHFEHRDLVGRTRQGEAAVRTSL